MILILLLGEKRLSKKRIWTLAATSTEHNATWRLRDTSRAQTNSSRTKAPEQASADAVSETLRVGKATGALSLNTGNFRRAREDSEQPKRRVAHFGKRQSRPRSCRTPASLALCTDASVSCRPHSRVGPRLSKQKESLVHDDLANPAGSYLSWNVACSATSSKNDEMR